MEKMSTGFGWIYGLVILFVAAVLIVIFTFVLNVHFMPVITEQINTSVDSGLTTQSVADNLFTENNKMLDFWYVIPFIILIGVIILWITLGIRKGQDGIQ